MNYNKLLSISLFSMLAISNAQSQEVQLELPVGVQSQVSLQIKLPNETGKCNIEITVPGQAKFEREVNAPNFQALVEFTPPAEGSFPIEWRGKLKKRGLNSVLGCDGAGKVMVVGKPSASDIAAKATKDEQTAETQKTSQRSPSERANVAVLTGKVDSGNSPAAVAAKTYDTGKIYYFKKGYGGRKGMCVSKRWGEGSSRNVSDGISYWGMHVYINAADKKRELGFFTFIIEEKNLFGTINSEPKTFEKVRDQDWQHCDFLIATGEELNSLPALINELNKPKTEFKLLHELTLDEAEKEWLNARGFKSIADYYNAATINWQISGETYATYSKLGITNIDQFNAAIKRRDAINCPSGYPSNFQGIIAFLTDEAASGKEKAPMEKYCAQRADKVKQEINIKAAELRRQELASPLLNCTKVNCTNSAEVESAVRNSWHKLQGKNSPWANTCFDAIKLVKDLRNTGQIFGPHHTTTAFRMCNQGLKELP